jgi:glycosyltransferase involved in cell wall biosynthesis
MNIIYDAQVFSFQEFGGISRYFVQLFNSLKQKTGINNYLPIKYSNNFYLDEITNLRHSKFFPDKRFKGRNSLMDKLNQYGVRKFVKNFNEPYIFHPTYFNPYFLKFINHNPFVITVYDMTHEIYSDTFKWFDPTSRNKKIVVNKADSIIAISENTKKDIVEHFKIDPQKIKVIYLANSINPETSAKNILKLPGNYLLFVGQRYSYKNFDLFVKASKPLLKEFKDLFLLCAGGGSFSNEELKTFDEYGISDKIIQMNVDDNTLAAMYSNAKAFVFPSLYEGFGIPVLEAFACGCPVILSNRSSLPEVGGDAALYFEPESIDDLEVKLSTILLNEEIGKDLVQKGFEREKLFSWEKTAEETLNVYRNLAV